jgi:hypothetical protein
VREQFLMAATAQNLKRLVRFLASMPSAKKQLRNLESASRSLQPLNHTGSESRFAAGAKFFNSYKTSGHLMTHPTSGQVGLEVRLQLILQIGGIDQSGADLVERRCESSFPVELFRICAHVYAALRPGHGSCANAGGERPATAVLGDYLRGRAFRRFAGTRLRLLVTGFMVSADSNKC